MPDIRAAASIMMAVFMFCHESQAEAERIAKGPIERHFASIYDAMSEHVRMAQSADYKGYDKMAEKVRQETFETQVQHNAAFVGTPDRIVEQLRAYDEEIGGCDHISMQVNFNDMPYDVAERSVRLFGEAVIPQFAETQARQSRRVNIQRRYSHSFRQCFCRIGERDMRTRLLVRDFGCLLAAMLCASPASARDEIRIGITGTFTGPPPRSAYPTSRRPNCFRRRSPGGR